MCLLYRHERQFGKTGRFMLTLVLGKIGLHSYAAFNPLAGNKGFGDLVLSFSVQSCYGQRPQKNMPHGKNLQHSTRKSLTYFVSLYILNTLQV